MNPAERAAIDRLSASVAERWAITNWAFYSAHRRIGFNDENAMYLTAENMTNLQLLANENNREQSEE